MTQQYIVGELSVFLARTQSVATNPAALDAAVQLRHTAETVPVTALASVVVRALELLDGLCWESLERGDSTAFADQAALGAELRQFGACTDLLPEDWR
jgi:hypothetical protein